MDRKPSQLETLEQRATEGALPPREAAAALGRVSLQLEVACWPEEQRRLAGTGRRIATAEVVEVLVDEVPKPAIDARVLAGALRLCGTKVIAAVLKRLYAQETDADRQPYYELVVRLASYPELRDSVTASLSAAQGERYHTVARQALMMVCALAWIGRKTTECARISA